jgi:hypothetical protein
MAIGCCSHLLHGMERKGHEQTTIALFNGRPDYMLILREHIPINPTITMIPTKSFGYAVCIHQGQTVDAVFLIVVGDNDLFEWGGSHQVLIVRFISCPKLLILAIVESQSESITKPVLIRRTSVNYADSCIDEIGDGLGQVGKSQTAHDNLRFVTDEPLGVCDDPQSNPDSAHLRHDLAVEALVQ